MKKHPSPIGHEFLNFLPDDKVIDIVRRRIPVFMGERNDKGGLSFKCPACKRGHHHKGSGLRTPNCFAKPPVHKDGYYVIEPLTDKGVLTVEVIKRSKVESFLKGLNGALFSIDYVKQDKTTRCLTGRLGVAPQKGGKNKVEALDRPYLTVFDIELGEYRNVNLDTATRIRVSGGVAYDIQD